MLPTQEPISKISAPVGKLHPQATIPWLRVEFSCGRKFEIAPVERYFGDERYPRLAIAIEEVVNFAEARSWPGGPRLAWLAPPALQGLAGQAVSSQNWVQRSETQPPEGYEATLTSGESLRVVHSQASPMSLEFTVRPIARSAA